MNGQLTDRRNGRAALFKGKGQPLELIQRQVPVLRKGEILVKNLYTTLCGSDVHTYCGRRIEPAQVVLGHEIVGDIVLIDEAHAGKDFRGDILNVGDRVTWSIFSVPPDSPAPRVDIPQKSNNLYKYGHALAVGNDVFNGGLADYCVLRPHTSIVKISRSMPLKVAATISCAHSTTAGALRIARDITGKSVLVFGAGLLGLSCLSMCKEAGAAWIGVIDNDKKRLAWGVRFGADTSFPFTKVPDVNPEFPWPEVDIVFDMTGDSQAMQTGMDSLKVGGCAVWIGAVFPNAPVQVDAQQVVRKVLQIRGLHNYNYQDFLAATIFIEKNFEKYPFEELIEKEFPLDEIQNAFEYASQHKPVRVGIPL